MAVIDVVVNGRDYKLSCEDGQETRLKRISAYVDRRIQDLIAQHGHIGDNKLMLMTSMMIADELSDAYEEIKQIRAALNREGGEGGDGGPLVLGDEAASAIGDAADRINEAIDSAEEADTGKSSEG